MCALGAPETAFGKIDLRRPIRVKNGAHELGVQGDSADRRLRGSRLRVCNIERNTNIRYQEKSQ